MSKKFTSVLIINLKGILKNIMQEDKEIGKISKDCYPLMCLIIIIF